MLMSLLYIGKNVTRIKGGADAVNYRNLSILKKIFEDKIIIIEPENNNYIDKLHHAISNVVIEKIEKFLSSGTVSHVIISSSLYGRAAQYIKKRYPQICIITFCHNIEVDYASSYFKTTGIKAIPFYATTKYWERKAMKYSDKIVTLNNRDAGRLTAVYKRISDCQLPVSFEDKFDQAKADLYGGCEDDSIDYLFVGVAFFPNVTGMQWFIDNVMPHVKGHLYIIGSRMDQVSYNNMNERIHVLGYVDDLSEYYYRAKMIVSPIFTGAGMKTKTAEALMYGKTIIGTNEAFEGYEIDCRCMMRANNDKEFIDSINYVENSFECRINPYSRQNFHKYHDNKRAERTLRIMFGEDQ